MKKVGIFLNDLGNSQIASQAVFGINNYLANSDDVGFILFFLDNVAPSALPMCPTMAASEIFGFDGTVIATSMETASRLASLSGPTRKLYYVVDLPWIRPTGVVPYSPIRDIFTNKEVELVARSESHCRIIENCFNRRPIATVEDFNVNRLVELSFPVS